MKKILSLTLAILLLIVFCTLIVHLIEETSLYIDMVNNPLDYEFSDYEETINHNKQIVVKNIFLIIGLCIASIVCVISAICYLKNQNIKLKSQQLNDLDKTE